MKVTFLGRKYCTGYYFAFSGYSHHGELKGRIVAVDPTNRSFVALQFLKRDSGYLDGN